MFGLMKNAGCQNPSQPEWYRLHYCGLCKSIGRKYDQKSRLLLNYDAVFLSEILTLLSSEETTLWDHEIQNYQCFSLPRKDDLPVSLDYASDVNMLLAQLKVQDNKLDDSKIIWGTVENIFRKPFGRVQRMLQKWQVDETTYQDCQREHFKRESATLPSDIQLWQHALHYYAAPTATITGYFFGQGANAINKPALKEVLYDLGYRFGELVYSLDAVKDFAEDMEQGKFNPLSAFFGPKRSQEEMAATAKDVLWDMATDVERSMEALPIPTEIQKAFQGRLSLNLSRELSSQATPCSKQKSGIEKSSIPRFYRLLDAVLARFNPAYPGKFAVTYLIFLGIFFSEKLLASLRLVSQHSAERTDWAFLWVVFSIPVVSYYLVKHSKKSGIFDNLKKLKARIKKRIVKLRKDPKSSTVLLIMLIALLVIIVAIMVVINSIEISLFSCKN